jgi:symplekin
MTAGLDDVSVKDEDSPVSSTGANLSNTIREQLYTYVLEDFRKRIEVAVSWLSEEWYNDRVQQRSSASASVPRDVPLHYEKWSLRLLDGFMPYLHGQDKVLTRFLSELPELNAAILSRVKTLCRDPALVNLALTSLYYLVMMRPPVRSLALDTVQDIWSDYEDSRPMAAKYLQKWRPGFLEAQQQGLGSGTSGAGAQPVAI